MPKNTFKLEIERSIRISLSEQIRTRITEAIKSGVLTPGTRLPSWIDLAKQLGISRGTVKTAYERLSDEQLVTSSRSKGTCVAEYLPVKNKGFIKSEQLPRTSIYQDFFFPKGHFKMGIPASDAFPSTLFARLFSASARKRISSQQLYADPRGEMELKREIAVQLALSRGVNCHPSQIFITSGFTGAMGTILHALGLYGKKVWVENPGFPPARRALEIAGLTLAPIPVDAEGIDVSYGELNANDAALVLITPGQQAPLGVTLSLERRSQLLAWAERKQSWIIEDDYLGELQLTRRAAPALVSMDQRGRVIYVGSFSKTISPTLRLGFMVVPLSLIDTVSDVVASLAPAPDPALQMAAKAFLHEGHFLRHLRKMKRTYMSRSDSLLSTLKGMGYEAEINGLSVLLKLPKSTDDIMIARYAYHDNLAPSPLSAWYIPDTSFQSGLLLGIADKEGEEILNACKRLDQLIRRFL
ncbi:PLP-dependent aminotransferase family protein [Providencia burhodogranariea]|uniref:MocR family transcriptional regulator n=1 Tax=Providencia burhodogranariea DSM 19968 TaxID=1141662 RepID=K8X9A6_9GAMM|nr:MocR family transcriptional regulator [Providencia burhodogranariea DSM 19968]